MSYLSDMLDLSELYDISYLSDLSELYDISYLSDLSYLLDLSGKSRNCLTLQDLAVKRPTGRASGWSRARQHIASYLPIYR